MSGSIYPKTKSRTVKSKESRPNYEYTYSSGPVTRRQQLLRENLKCDSEHHFQPITDRPTAKTGDIVPCERPAYRGNSHRSASKTEGSTVTTDDEQRLDLNDSESSVSELICDIPNENELAFGVNTVNWINSLPETDGTNTYIQDTLSQDQGRRGICNGYILKNNSGRSHDIANRNRSFLYFSSDFVTQIALFMYIINSWNFAYYYSYFMVDSYLKNNSLMPTTFEGQLLYKVIWCCSFGVAADFVSWKTAFYLQAFMLLLLLLVYFIPIIYIADLVAVICFSSSDVVVFYIGAVKIWGHLNCLSHIARMSAITCFLPAVFSTVFLKRILTYQNETENSGLLPSSVKYAVAKCAFPFILLISSAFCLLTVTLTKEKSLQHCSSSCCKTSIGRKIFSVILLKVLVCIPFSLALSFYNDNAEAAKKTALIILTISIVIQMALVPAISLCASLRTLLIMCTFLLFTLYVILGTVRNWSSTPIIFIPLSGIMCLWHSYFEVYFISELHKYSGVTVGILTVSHLVIRYVCDVVYNSVKASSVCNIFVSQHFCFSFIDFDKICVSLSPVIKYVTGNELQCNDWSVFANMMKFFCKEDYSTEHNEIFVVSCIGAVFSAFSCFIFFRSQ